MTVIIEQMLKGFTVVQLMNYEILSEWCYNVEGFCKKETAEIQKRVGMETEIRRLECDR